MRQKSLLYWLILGISVTLIAPGAYAGKNRIVELNGTAEIKLKGEPDYEPVFQGVSLIKGDILFPAAATVVKIRCSDGKLKQAQAGVPSPLGDICPGAKSTDPRAGSSIFTQLLDGDFTPQTLLLTNPPLLSWPSIAGASHYQVKMMANHEIIWQKTITATRIRYEGEPLQPEILL